MKILFSSGKLEKTFNNERFLKKEYGEQAEKIKRRMAVLRAAPNLAQVPPIKPDRRHELSGKRKGTFAVDLKQPFRLIFEPADDPIPRLEDGSIDLSKIISVRILAVEDYH